MSLDDLKKQRSITRDDIEILFESLGAPGENRDAKVAAMKSLNRQNRQGIDISETADTYRNW